MFAKFISSEKIEYAGQSIVVGNKRICNPTDDILRANGYKEFISSEPPSSYYNFEYVDGYNITMQWIEWSNEMKLQFYPTLVNDKIRLKYSINDELALLRQKDIKAEEYTEYNNYAEQCKIEAKQELGLLMEEDD